MPLFFMPLIIAAFAPAAFDTIMPYMPLDITPTAMPAADIATCFRLFTPLPSLIY